MATQEQIANYREWQRRETLASARVESGQYGYTDPQPENDGVSLASTHDEIATLENEYQLTLKEIESMNRLITNNIRESRMGNVTRCPTCGKLIALVFPIHDCKPTGSKDRLRQIRKEIETCGACADQSSIAAPGQSVHCRTHQRALDAETK